MTTESYERMLDLIVATPNTDPANRVECGECGFKWDDSISTSFTPAPSGRCPNEYNHAEESEEETEYYRSRLT